MEKEGETKSAVSIVEEATGNNPNPVATDDTAKEPLYFTRDGKLLFGTTPPTAFAVSYPYPPLPSNLSKNRVLRALDEKTTETVHEGIVEAEKEYEKEAMPLPTLSIQGSSLPKVLIPEIELAIYWDRHPYEFRVPEKGKLLKPDGYNNGKINESASSMRRSKSEMNLASKVGELLEERSVTENSNSRRSSNSVSASHKAFESSRSTSVSSVRNSLVDERNVLSSPKNTHYNNHLAPTSNGNERVKNRNAEDKSANSSRKSSAKDGNHESRDGSWRKLNNDNDKRSCEKHSGKANVNQQLQMSESERKKFEDIKMFRHQNERQSQGQSTYSRPKLIRSQEPGDSNIKKSTGVQVTIDDVAAAALKSTYLCPLHGQYKRGIERRDKGGFRTDMSSVNNVHAHCSRALKGKPSRTKMIKTAETQTEREEEATRFQSGDNRTNKRSRTAGHIKKTTKGKDIMASEYHGSFRDPYKIADAEKRHLRNKILNYCFTKHSIF